MNTQINLAIGDVSENGQITILDEDKLSYLVESHSRGAVGIRTISKNLLREYINYLLLNPNATPDEIRVTLSGKSEIDKFEYGYTSTLTAMAKMSIANQSKSPVLYKRSSSLPLQQIFYGAPGTGKSHKVKEVTDSVAKEFVFRTTFHPDSDYSTFVGAYKPTMKQLPIYNQQTGAQIGVEDKIVYSFVPQAFLKAYVAAWQNPEQSVFLVIEEINRGNCAQIFGDIFQLLDRKEGVSEYPIKADQDIRDYLAKEFAGYDLKANILSGEELVLPANLHIWATMNTSDQSLFPIDSAFKRRWDWKYMPIHDAGENWTIALSDVEYDWWDFVEKINNVIGNMTSSEDKKLGYFFCKACNGKIDAEKFVNKVVFYLWNDVFKDYELSDKAFQDGEGKLTFNKFYTPAGDANDETIVKFLDKDHLNVKMVDSFHEQDTSEEESIIPPTTTLSTTRKKSLDFWTAFLDYAKENPMFSGKKPTADSWKDFGIEGIKHSDAHMCLEHVRTLKELRVTLVTSKKKYNELETKQADIERELIGSSVEWRDSPKTNMSAIRLTLNDVDFDDIENQEKLFEYFIKNTKRLVAIAEKYIK